MAKNNKQGKGPAKGPQKKKVKVLKQQTRQKWTCEQKDFARDLKKQGKQPNEIIKIFKDKYDVVVKPSTLATWYNTRNMATHEQRGPRNTSMASVETHVNPKQRPTILIDMEYALVHMLRKANNFGGAVTKGALTKMGKCIFMKLRALKIYDAPGARLKPLSDLNEDQINTLLEDATKDSVPCPLCQAPVRSGNETLLVHIQDFHNVNDDEQIPSRAGVKEFTFEGSSGWLRNFLTRHNMHNVLIVGEMGSNNQEAAKDYVEKFRDEGSQEIEEFETNNNSNKLSEFDLYKQSDVELNKKSDVEIDKQCNVELNNQNDGELDIDCIKTQLNSLPCIPGGKCSCDTDFTSQVPEYILDLFNTMPDSNIIIVDEDKIVYL